MNNDSYSYNRDHRRVYSVPGVPLVHLYSAVYSQLASYPRYCLLFALLHITVTVTAYALLLLPTTAHHHIDSYTTMHAGA